MPIQHFKVGHPPPYTDVVPPAAAADDDMTEEQSCEARGPLPPYRDVEEGAEGEEGEEGSGASYAMHPQDFERPAKMMRATALRRWLVRSCDASLALFFIGFTVVGVVLWFWFK